MINIFNALFLCMLRIYVCDLRSASWCMAWHLPTYINRPSARAPGVVLLYARLGRAYGFSRNERNYIQKKYFVLGHLTVHFLINTIHYRSKLHLQTPHSSIWSNVLLLPDTSFRYALGLLRNLNAGLPACIYSGQPAPIISAILLFFFVHIETISTCSI